jgi:hypothetical protein
MPVPTLKDTAPPSTLPRPTGRYEWLRWPVAWGLAICASLGLLAAIGIAIPSGIRLVPERLLAVLQIPVGTAPGATLPAPFAAESGAAVASKTSDRGKQADPAVANIPTPDRHKLDK